MKTSTLLCLVAAAALFVACGGSEQSAGQPGNIANMTFSGITEAQEYLTSHYTEDQMKEMYVEFAALSVADNDYYYKKDASGMYIQNDEETEKEILEKMNENITAVIKRFGINHALFAALMMQASTTDWPLSMDDQVKARAKEINDARGGN